MDKNKNVASKIVQEIIETLDWMDVQERIESALNETLPPRPTIGEIRHNGWAVWSRLHNTEEYSKFDAFKAGAEWAANRILGEEK